MNRWVVPEVALEANTVRKRRSQHRAWREPALQSQQVTTQTQKGSGKQQGPSPQNHAHSCRSTTFSSSLRNSVPEAPLFNPILAKPQTNTSPGPKSSNLGPSVQLKRPGSTWAHLLDSQSSVQEKGVTFPLSTVMEVLLGENSHSSVFSGTHSLICLYRSRLETCPGGPESQVPAPYSCRRAHLRGLSLPHHTQNSSSKWQGRQLVGPPPASLHLLAG